MKPISERMNETDSVMTNDDDKFRVKLAQALLLMSSNKDGEVVAAAHAIDRLLKSAKWDWHDLADLVRDGGKRLAPDQQQAGWDDEDDEWWSGKLSASDIRALMMVHLYRDRLYSADAKDFINIIFAFYQKYGARAHLSAKQRKYLRSLEQNLQSEVHQAHERERTTP